MMMQAIVIVVALILFAGTTAEVATVNCRVQEKCYTWQHGKWWWSPCQKYYQYSVDHRLCTTNEMRNFQCGTCDCAKGFISYCFNGNPVCCFRDPHELCTLENLLNTDTHGSCDCRNSSYVSKNINNKCVCCKKHKYKTLQFQSSTYGRNGCPAYMYNHWRPQMCYLEKTILYECSRSEYENWSSCSSSICPADHTCRRSGEEVRCCPEMKSSTTSSIITTKPITEWPTERNCSTSEWASTVCDKTCASFDAECRVLEGDTITCCFEPEEENILREETSPLRKMNCTSKEMNGQSCYLNCPNGTECKTVNGWSTCCSSYLITPNDKCNSGTNATRSCRKNDDCGDCSFVCEKKNGAMGVCCERVKIFEEVVLYPKTFCMGNGQCTAQGEICIDGGCILNTSLPDAFKAPKLCNNAGSTIHCPNNCCPVDMVCNENNVCC